MKRFVPALLLVALLGACQTQPAAPQDRYYQLPAVIAQCPTPCQRWTEEPVAVRELRASGPYLDRAILYSEAASGAVLQAYHYHHWIYAPGQLVQQHLIRNLPELGLAPTQEGEGQRTGWQLSGRVLHFERHSATHSALVELELQLARPNAGPLLRKTYRASVTASDASMEQFVVAMQRALFQITSEFVRDVRALRPA